MTISVMDMPGSVIVQRSRTSKMVKDCIDTDTAMTWW